MVRRLVAISRRDLLMGICRLLLSLLSVAVVSQSWAADEPKNIADNIHQGDPVLVRTGGKFQLHFVGAVSSSYVLLSGMEYIKPMDVFLNDITTKYIKLGSTASKNTYQAVVSKTGKVDENGQQLSIESVASEHHFTDDLTVVKTKQGNYYLYNRQVKDGTRAFVRVGDYIGSAAENLGLNAIVQNSKLVVKDGADAHEKLGTVRSIDGNSNQAQVRAILRAHQSEMGRLHFRAERLTLSEITEINKTNPRRLLGESAGDLDVQTQLTRIRMERDQTRGSAARASERIVTNVEHGLK